MKPADHIVMARRRSTKNNQPAKQNSARDRRSYLVVVPLLVALVIIVFWQTLGDPFSSYDDDKYVTANPHVQAGLTKESIVWAFTSAHASNWHPLTWISHMLDCQVYGMNPMGHHLTNLLFHIANTLLLFLVLSRMTKSIWRSAFVAALFGIHPLRVESVAWVAERKDVLSTFFFMLTVLSYVWYVKRPNVGRYPLVLALFAFGLMAKPMLVTLPFILLLLDYWPLGRFQSKGKKAMEGSWTGWKLIWEKAPLFALSAASSVATYLAQRLGGAVRELDQYPLGIRVANTLVAYISYIRKMIWPSDLAVFYPHPGKGLPEWQVVGTGLLLAGIFVLVIRAWRRRPYLAVGWLWYIGTLIPVIGLVQVGLQGMADRYSYVPLIGLFIMIAWGVPDLMSRKGRAPRAGYLAVLAGLAVCALTVCAWIQVGYWRGDVALFSHAIEVTRDNAIAHNNLGRALKIQGKFDEAFYHYREALRIAPRYADAQYNFANALMRRGKIDEAIAHYYEAIKLNPKSAEAHNNLANTLASQGRTEEAFQECQEAIRLKPDLAKAHNNLAIMHYAKGRYAEAWTEVHLARRYGVSPRPEFIEALARKMPEPKE